MISVNKHVLNVVQVIDLFLRNVQVNSCDGYRRMVEQEG